MKNNRSEKAFNKALKVIPGGVNSPVRSFSNINQLPVFVARGEGSKVTDVDGNTYIDYIGSWGPLILGHANPVIYQEALERIQQGNTFGLPTEIETELADLIVDAFDSIDQVRFVNSGTEAVMSALRLVRGYTGKDKIIKFEGGYHGHVDSMLVKSGSGVLTHGNPSSSGVTHKTAEDTLVGVYNSIESVQSLIERNPDEIAAVIIEPVAGNMGVIPPNRGFLEDLRKITEENEILLIFDEVITGFRTTYGGVQTLTNVEPDITTLGKIIGGGLPVGAFGGKKKIMNMLSPSGPVYQAGTLSGNPLVMHFGRNLLSYLKNNPELYTHLSDNAERLRNGIIESAKKYQIPVSVNIFKGMLTVFFTKNSPVNYTGAFSSNLNNYARFFKGMLEEGILIPPSQFEGWFLSEAHGIEDIEKTIQAAGKVLKEMSQE